MGCALQRLLPARLRRRPARRGGPGAGARRGAARRRRRPAATCSTCPAASAATRVPLAAAGYRATGVDRSPTLLDEARRRAGGQRWPKFAKADYRDLPFADASFDAALNLFSSLGFLGDAEDTRALAEIGRTLRPGGRLVLEIMHRDLLVASFSEQDWRLVGEGRLLLEQRTFDPAAGIAQVTQTLIGSDGTRESRPFSVRIYTATELLAMLRAAGFTDARCTRRLRRRAVRAPTPAS